jgi:hypothetical protein
VKKTEINSEAQLEKSVSELSELIEKRKAIRRNIDELRDEIHLEIIRDGLVWSPNISFEDNVEFHRQVRRGHGQAQYLCTKLPPLQAQQLKLNEEIKSLIEQIAKPCAELRAVLDKNLRKALAENHAAVTERIRPLSADEQEANELARLFSVVEETQSRLPLQFGFDPEKPVESARGLLREFRRPIPAVNLEMLRANNGHI